MPRWSPSSHSLPLSSPTSLSTNQPELGIVPADSVPLSADARDGPSQDAKQDSNLLQNDSLAEILPGTPEGLYLKIQKMNPRSLFYICVYNYILQKMANIEIVLCN